MYDNMKTSPVLFVVGGFSSGTALSYQDQDDACHNILDALDTSFQAWQRITCESLASTPRTL